MMTRVTKRFGKKLMFRLAALATVGLGVSGCTYDMGLGYASDGYGSGYYECDPYGGYDSYYDCDNSYGFSNIGYTGGWYNDYWYPGYGFYLFDNGGRRYAMRDNDRRYWGERRHNWYRENRGRRRDGGRYQGQGRGYTGNAAPGTIGWPERNGGRVRDGDDNRRDRGDGRRDRNRGWQGGQGNSVNAIPTPTPEAARGEPNRSGRGDGMRPGGQDRSGWRNNDGANAVPVPRPDRPAAGRGDGGGRAYRAPPQTAPEAIGQSVAPRVAPAPRPQRAERAPSTRQNRNSGERVQEQ
jgi:hypothetical protein